MTNRKCPISNKKLADFLRSSSLNRLKNIAKRLGIENYRDLSKNELILKIRNNMPDEYWTTEIPKNSLTEFLIHLPKNFKNFIITLAEGDPNCEFGVWRLKNLRGKYKVNLDLWINKLKRYGIVFEIKKSNEEYLVVPEDIWSSLINTITLLEPSKNISFESFLNDYLSKEDLQHICRIYGLKVSGNKKELAYNIISSEVSPKDVLFVMYHADLIELAKQLNVYPWNEKNPKNIDRDQLIDDIANHIISTQKVDDHVSIKTLEKGIYPDIVNIISNKFKPILKWNSKEPDIEKQLISYLLGFFDGKNIETDFISEYKLPSGGKVDIYETKNNIGIELKYNPSRTHLRETVQRIKEYKEDLSKIIVAIFYEEFHYSDTKMLEKYKKIIENIQGTRVILRKF